MFKLFLFDDFLNVMLHIVFEWERLGIGLFI
jgi:hypothetical protein